MKQLGKISVVLALVLFAASCADKNSPNYQYMPNMYEPVGYETYQAVDNGLFPKGTEALLPAEGTISRGYMPYEFENTPEPYLEGICHMSLKTLQKVKNLQGLIQAHWTR